jgi:ariadne-1
VKGLDVAELGVAELGRTSSGRSRWEALPDLPAPRCGASATVACGLRSIPVDYPETVAAKQRLCLAKVVLHYKRAPLPPAAQRHSTAVGRLAEWWHSGSRSDVILMLQMRDHVPSKCPTDLAFKAYGHSERNWRFWDDRLGELATDAYFLEGSKYLSDMTETMASVAAEDFAKGATVSIDQAAGAGARPASGAMAVYAGEGGAAPAVFTKAIVCPAPVSGFSYVLYRLTSGLLWRFLKFGIAMESAAGAQAKRGRDIKRVAFSFVLRGDGWRELWRGRLDAATPFLTDVEVDIRGNHKLRLEVHAETRDRAALRAFLPTWLDPCLVSAKAAAGAAPAPHVKVRAEVAPVTISGSVFLHTVGAQRDSVLDTEALLQWQSSMIADVAASFGCGRTTAKTLLAAHSYDMQTMTTVVRERWHSPRQRAKLLASIGGATEQTSSEQRADPTATTSCGVCWDDCRAQDITAAACGHFFCNDCWGGHIEALVSTAQLVIPCMEMGCKQTVDEAMVTVLTPPSVAAKFTQFAMATFIEECPALKKCRNPGCELTIKMAPGGAEHQDIVCDIAQGGCGWMSCGAPGCWAEAHYPCSCEHAKKWEELQGKSDPDGGSIHDYLDQRLREAATGNSSRMIGIRPCPRCSRSIEKNGACKHMVCGGYGGSLSSAAANVARGVACGCSWCWVCGRIIEPWNAGHSGCGTYQGPTSLRDPGAVKGLHELSHYQQRHQHHDEAQAFFLAGAPGQDAFEQEVAEITHGGATLQPEDLHLISSEYVPIAGEVLVEAQRKLKWAYAYAYFFPRVGAHSSRARQFGSPRLFEAVLEHLVGVVERLSELVQLELPGRMAGLAARMQHKQAVIAQIDAVNMARPRRRGSGPETVPGAQEGLTICQVYCVQHISRIACLGPPARAHR